MFRQEDEDWLAGKKFQWKITHDVILCMFVCLEYIFQDGGSAITSIFSEAQSIELSKSVVLWRLWFFLVLSYSFLGSFFSEFSLCALNQHHVSAFGKRRHDLLTFFCHLIIWDCNYYLSANYYPSFKSVSYSAAFNAAYLNTFKNASWTVVGKSFRPDWRRWSRLVFL